MVASSPNETVRDGRLSYRIDRHDCFCAFGPGWDAALPPELQSTHTAAQLLGWRLWDCFADDDTSRLYRVLVQRVRSGAMTTFAYRCDLPDQQRTYRMRLTMPLALQVEFTSWLEYTSPSTPVALFDAKAPRDPARRVHLCSICQKVEMATGQWVPAELAAATGELLPENGYPQLRHGVCQQCQRLAEAQD